MPNLQKDDRNIKWPKSSGWRFLQVDFWEVGHFSLQRKSHMIDFETGLCFRWNGKIFQLFQFYFVENLIYSNFSLNLPNKIFEIKICFA
jgi:hypothetical protein